MASYMDRTFNEWVQTYGPVYRTFKRIHKDMFVVEDDKLSMQLLRKESEWFQEQFPTIVCSLIVEKCPVSRTYYFEFLFEGKTLDITYRFFMDHKEDNRVVFHNFTGIQTKMLPSPFLDFQEPFQKIATTFIEWVESRNENRLLVVTS